MNAFLLTAAGLTILGGVLHSFLGERLILGRLATHTLPETLGSTRFTKRILRLMWHAISIAWWGIAGVLVVLASLADLDPTATQIATIIVLTFLASSVYALIQTRGKHFSWGLFLAIAVTTWLGIR